MCCAAQSHIIYLPSTSMGQKLGIFCSFVAVDDGPGQRLPEECINALAGLGRRLLAEHMGWDKAVAGGSNEGFWQFKWSARARAATSSLCYRIFCCRSTGVETIGLRVVQLSQKRKREGRNGVGRTWWQHISEVFSVLFETWVTRAGRELFPSAFHLYVLPHWSMSVH